MIHVITGQTATGKTSYALKLAAELNGELISVDARQLYKELDIVTGKDLHLADRLFHKIKELNSFDLGYYEIKTSPTRLWLYDVVAPNQPFSTYDYKACAQWVIDDIESRGKVPIIVGGSYFYIQHFLYNTVENEAPPNQELREQLKDASIIELQNKLKQINAHLFEGLNNSEQHNPQRLIRRIEKEIYNKSPLAREYPRRRSGRRDVSYNITGFQFENKDYLKNIISDRVENRLNAGAILETEKLLKKGYKPHDPGLKTIGYTQIIQYLNKEISLDEMKNIWISKEIQYAKRQLTFMKKNNKIEWINI